MARPRPRRQDQDMAARLARVITEYDNFMGSNDDDPERAKRFYARHNAAKAAIAHADALQKIGGNSTQDGQHDSSVMVARARAALAQEGLPDEAED